MFVPQKKYIIANWKIHPETLSEALSLAQSYTEGSSTDTEVVVCPSMLFLYAVSQTNPTLSSFGIQNISLEELSLEQVVSLGIRYALVGHSQRRALGESDEDVRKKIQHCLEQDIIPIVCVGENTRDAEGRYLKELEQQIMASFHGYSKSQLEHMIIAYEPVWAIGEHAKREATPEEFEQSMIFIKKVLNDMTGNSPVGKITVIYGGSVDSVEKMRAYLTVGASGILLGRASLDASLFNTLCSEMKKTS